MSLPPRPGLQRGQRVTLAADSSALLDPGGAPWSLSVIPEDGATVTVEITVTPAADIAADVAGAVWHVLGEPLTAAELIAFPSPVTAIRLSTADAGATAEVVS